MISYSLDIRTISLLLGLVSMTLSLVMIYVKLTQRTYEGFACWTAAAVSLSVGMLFFNLRGICSDFLTVIVANFLVLSFFALVPYGLNCYLRRSVSDKWFILPFVLFFLSFPYFTYFNPSINARIVVFSALISAFLFYSAWSVLKYSKNLNIQPNGLLILAFTVPAVFLVFRIVYTLAYESAIQDFMAASVMHGVSFILCVMASIVTFVGLIIFNMQRVEREFLDTEKEVISLKGIIPICMHCKGIRDDKGYWNQLEKFVSENSNVKFSHGICDKCLKKHYPDIDE